MESPKPPQAEPVETSTETPDYEGRRHPLDGVAGWGISLLFHAMLLVTFTVLTWMPGGGPASAGPEEVEAGIVIEQKRPAIELGKAKPIDVAGSDSQLLVPEFKATTEIQQIPSLGMSASSSAASEALIGLDMGSGSAASAMKGDWGALAGGGGLGGGGGGTSFFGLQARGGKFVFVVDRSGSMRGEKLKLATDELLRAINRLTSGRKFYIIFFDHTHTAMQADKLVRATRANKERHFPWVRNIRSRGGTDPRSAMQLALSLKPNTIWLLSDGMFQDPNGAIAVIRKANPRKRIQIHTIAYWSDAGKRVLEQIAKENHGQYQFIPPPRVRRRRRPGR